MAPSVPPAATVALLCAFRLHVGGVETHLLSLLRRSQASHYRWLVIAPTSPAFQASVTALGAEVLPWQPESVLDIGALLRLVRLLRAHDVGLLHVHDPRAGVFGRVAARLLRLPVVVTVHLPAYGYVYGKGVRPRLRRGLYRRVERLLNSRFTDRLIYVSSRTCGDALRQGLAPPEKTRVIENGIDLLPYTRPSSGTACRPSDLPPGVPVICTVCRLDVQKGVDVLLDALGRIGDQYGLWQLWIVGDGPERAKLEAQADRLGIHTHVLFLGYRNDVPDLLMASDVFVLASRYEAMPMVLVEAMAAGLPAVVTDVGENAHLVEHQRMGLVVPPEDSSALAGALGQLLSDPALRGRMGQAAKGKALLHSDERMVQRILEVYTAALAADRRRA